MSKYKSGDRVVFIKPTTKNDGRMGYLNKVITLDKIDCEVPDVHWTFKENEWWIVRESEIEHEAVYNSPLYKALS